MANRTRSKKRSKNKKSKKQRGGADFSQAQRQELLDLGFTEDHIDTLTQVFPNTDADVVMNLIHTSLGQINNDTGLPNTPQEIIDSLNPDNNENDLSEIGSENGSDVNNVSVGSFAFENENEDNLSDIDDDNGSQHNISDDSFDLGDDLDNNNLNNNIDDISEDSISDQGDTTREDSRMSIGELDDDEDDHQNAGRRRKTRKGRKGKKTKKQRGGMRYGTGVGSNCFDPNFSIYNTPALTLFPYKPN